MSKRVMSKKDLELLEWIYEQYAVREDQLARLLGRSRASARRWASVMRDAGLCRRELLLRGEPACVWLTGAGAKLTEHQFRPWRGHLGKLEHIGAVGDLRIHLARRAPAASWVSERELLSNQAAALFGRDGHKRSDAPHIPDAGLVLPSGERRSRTGGKARGSGQSPVSRLLAGDDPQAARSRSGVDTRHPIRTLDGTNSKTGMLCPGDVMAWA